jgi:hypothetical protein
LGGSRFSPTANCPHQLLRPIQASSGLKWSGLEADHSPVLSCWNHEHVEIYLISTIRLHGFVLNSGTERLKTHLDIPVCENPCCTDELYKNGRYIRIAKRTGWSWRGVGLLNFSAISYAIDRGRCFVYYVGEDVERCEAAVINLARFNFNPTSKEERRLFVYSSNSIAHGHTEPPSLPSCPQL